MSIVVSYVYALLSRCKIVRLGVVYVIKYIQEIARFAHVRHLALVKPLDHTRCVAGQLRALQRNAVYAQIRWVRRESVRDARSRRYRKLCISRHR